jgi:hypothetical protein
MRTMSDTTMSPAASGSAMAMVGLAAIDPESGKQIADVKLDAHPESFQLEKKGKRIFVNVPNAGHVAVVDRETGTVIEKDSFE